MTESFDAVDVIVTKRDGHRLSDAQIDWVIDAYTRGVVAEEQMSALNMAILLNGMDRAEIAMLSADICSSATAPRVYASMTQSICASDRRCPSRLATMTSTASNDSVMPVPPGQRARRRRGAPRSWA